MKRLLLISLFLTLVGYTYAQVTIVPKLSLDMGDMRFGSDTAIYGDLAFNTDITLRFKTSDNFYLGIGAGFFRSISNEFYGKSYTIPVFINARWGNELYLDANLGYHIPLNSTGYGFLTGLYSRIGLGLCGLEDDGKGPNIGVYVDLLRLFWTSEVPKYVPDGYIPVSSGFNIGAYIEYSFPISSKKQ